MTPPGTSRSGDGSAEVAAELFRLLVDQVREYAIFLLDPDGRVASWNAGAERIKGYEAAEILGRHFSAFYPPEDAAAGKADKALARAARDGHFQAVGWRVRKSGERFMARVTLTALYDDQGRLRGFAKITQDVTAEREAQRTLHEREQQLAEAHAQEELSHRLQVGLLPNLSLRTPTLTLRTRYQPGQERALLGADFYDALELPDGTVALLIGDVAGHGPEEAAVGVALRAAWGALVLSGHDPGELLNGLDRVLVHERPSVEVFTTVCCAWVSADRSRVTVALAGHPPPLLGRDGKVEAVPVPGGPALGIHDDAYPYESGVVEVGDKWTLLCYTDGLVEGHSAPGSVERFGIEALVDAMVERVGQSVGLDELVDGLLDVVHAANGGDLSDDVAILCVGHCPRTADTATPMPAHAHSAGAPPRPETPTGRRG